MWGNLTLWDGYSKLAVWAERSMCGNYAALTANGTLEHELATSGCAHRGGTRLTTPKAGMQTADGENLREGTCVGIVQRRTHAMTTGLLPIENVEFDRCHRQP